MTIDNRLEVFSELVLSCHDLFFWKFDSQLNLRGSNCPDEELLSKMFVYGNTAETLQSFEQIHKKPLIFTSDIGLIWLIEPEIMEDKIGFYHVLGPFFFDDQSSLELAAPLEKLCLSPTVMQEVLRVLRKIPVVSPLRISEYGIMLHQCVFGEKIAVSDMHFRGAKAVKTQPVSQAKVKSIHGTYEMEQEMVRLVREGNLNFRDHMAKLAVTGAVGKLANGDSLRQLKNTILTCIVLFSRAAIEGGLSPETSMTLADRYFQSVEDCGNLTELSALSRTMQQDFVQRVHRCRSMKLSQPIQNCCEYIGLHLDEDLSLRSLAERYNYSEYYLSHRFKKEMGVNIKEYIRSQRLQRAKLLLKDPAKTVRDVSDQLHFCSQSYFSESFKSEFGMSPSQWREMAKE